MKAKSAAVILLIGVLLGGALAPEVQALAVAACAEGAHTPGQASVGTMYVLSIGMSARPYDAGYLVRGAVHIAGEGGEAVDGAAVTAEWTLPCGSVRIQRAGTDAAGRAAFAVRSAQAGRYQLCVTSVAKDGWQYDPGLNRETFDTLSVP